MPASPCRSVRPAAEQLFGCHSGQSSSMGRLCRLGVRRDRSHWFRRFPARLFPGFERVAAKRWEEAGAPITFPIKEQDRGQTPLNTASLSHALEGDLRTLPNVSGAMVGLFGTAPEIELRSVLDVTDRIDPQGLPQKFEVLGNLSPRSQR